MTARKSAIAGIAMNAISASEPGSEKGIEAIAVRDVWVVRLEPYYPIGS
jgi:hypothetical protein